MSLGYTSTGFLRKRFVEFVADMKSKLESATTPSGDPVFPGVTTLNDIDKYAGTPLVELVTATSASDHDIHEVAETMAQNMNPRDAEGVWLDSHAVAAGLLRKPNESDTALRKRLLSRGTAFARSNFGRGTDAVVADILGVECVRYSTSTHDSPIEGIPVPGAMLAVLGNGGADEIAQAIWDTTQIGTINFVGDDSGKATGLDGKCHFLTFQRGCRVMIGVRITASLDFCSEATLESLPALLVDKFRELYFCEQVIIPSMVRDILAGITGVSVHKVELARRAKQLSGKNADGEYCGVTEVYLGDDVDPTPWASDETCGKCAGEIWCDFGECSVVLKPWEFADMAEPLIEIVGSEVPVC